jgi:short-chain fatty acids transporter
VLKVKGVHYPLIIAAAYSGFTMYGLGLSASIPVLVATPGHPTSAQMGTIPLSETIFSIPMLLTSLAIIITLPLLNAWLHPTPRPAIAWWKSIPPSIRIRPAQASSMMI